MTNDISNHNGDNERTINDSKVQIILPPGKWRRSLCAWKKNSISLSGKGNSNEREKIELKEHQFQMSKNVEILNKKNNNSKVLAQNQTLSLDASKSINLTTEINETTLRNSSIPSVEEPRFSKPHRAVPVG
ncbi:uncharacterized protein LOC129614405 [Condylostylus longicornis]|uniref:uncharacterized protein LOC129614405 n=1 Tax=Condylostylus longicornis TaxID=2530218 RepID=UPI00244E34CB|nr:uncharacterized protein LOC129614405 [Condylostylus longicornis]